MATSNASSLVALSEANKKKMDDDLKDAIRNYLNKRFEDTSNFTFPVFVSFNRHSDEAPNFDIRTTFDDLKVALNMVLEEYKDATYTLYISKTSSPTLCECDGGGYEDECKHKGGYWVNGMRRVM
jgi:hypothetical protein